MAEGKPDRLAATAEYFDRRLETIEQRLVSLTDALADLADVVDRIADGQAQMGTEVSRIARRPQLRVLGRRDEN